MRRSIQIAVVLLAATAACASAQASRDAALSAMSDQERRLALHGDITAQANRCNSVSYAGRSGQDASGTAYWDVRCNGGPTYRLAVPASALARTVVTGCGTEAPAPMAGPCFQSVGGRSMQLASNSSGIPVSLQRQVLPDDFAPGNAMLGTAARGARCEATCARALEDSVSACVAICLQGGDVNAAPVGADGGAAFGRFGAIYATKEPAAAWGFANGQVDRLAVNREAATACHASAGTAPCLFQMELVNQCGAIARAQRRDPRALVATGQASTMQVLAFATGAASTENGARSAALASCRVQVARTSNPNLALPACEVIVSGC